MKKINTYGKQPFLFRIGQAMSKRGFLSCSDVAGDDMATDEISVINDKGEYIPLYLFIFGA